MNEEPLREDILDRYWDALVKRNPDDSAQLRGVFAASDDSNQLRLLEDLNDVRLLLRDDSTIATVRDATAAKATPADEIDVGIEIDGYTITRRLGRGGMGVVFAAQQHTLGREVALKLIRMGPLATPEELARFTAEATAAACLQHPGVVAVYDSGQWKGYHYFSMELVNGPTLAQMLSDGPLEPEQAIRFVRQICEAIQHAHDRGILHRDLKPSNILIDRDQARITDFGLAKLFSDGGDPALTQSGAMVGTPSYMSPEQALGESKRVTISSDVYSIGAILYELLTGRAPFRAASPVETMRQVVDELPASPHVLNPGISRDLETVCLKCLEKNPAARYHSVQALEQELNRIECGLPILSRPLSRLGKTWRWCQRQPALAASLGLLVVSLLAGTVTSSVMWRKSVQHAREAESRLIAESAAKAEAQQQADNAIAVTSFFTEDVLGQADPFSNSDRDVKVSTVLDAAADKIEERFQNRPLIEAAVRSALGNTYLSLGKLDLCQHHLQRAVELLQQTLGPDDPQTLKAMHRVGMFLYSSGRYAEAEVQYRNIVQLSQRALGPDNEETLNSMGQLAHVIFWQNRFDEAEKIFLEVLEKQSRIGPDSLPTLQTMNNLGILYSNSGRYAEAEKLLLETLAIQRRIFGNEYPDTLTSLNNLGHLYCTMGDFEKAQPYYEEALATRKRVLGNHPHTCFSLHNMGMFHWQQGRREEALPFFEEAFEMRKQQLGLRHPNTQQSLRMRCQALIELGRSAEALPFCEQALRVAEENETQNWELPFSKCLLGAALAGQKEFERAEQLLLEGYADLIGTLEEMSLIYREQTRVFAAEQIVALYEAWEKPEEAANWREKTGLAVEKAP